MFKFAFLRGARRKLAATHGVILAQKVSEISLAFGKYLMLWSKNCFLPLGRKKFCEKFSQWRERKEEEGRPSNDNQSVRPFRCSQVFNFLKMNFFFISNISLFFGANLPIPIDTSHIILPTMAPGLNSC